MVISVKVNASDHVFGWNGHEVGHTIYANTEKYPNPVLETEGIDLSPHIVVKARYTKVHRLYLDAVFKTDS